MAEVVHGEMEHSDWFPESAKMHRSRTEFIDLCFWKADIQKENLGGLK